MFLQNMLGHVVVPDSFNSARHCPPGGSSRFWGKDRMAEFTLEWDITTRFVLGIMICEPISEMMLIQAFGRQSRCSVARECDGDGALRSSGASAKATGGMNSNLRRYVNVQYHKIK
jgi:hypothetical protein